MKSALGLALGLSALLGCPESPLGEARSLESKGQLAEAAAAYREAAKRDPANMAAWDGAARLFCEELALIGECLGVLDLELDQLGGIGRHTESYAKSLEKRARERISQGLAAAAIDDIDRALRVAPERAELLVVRARASLMLGRPEAAEKDLDRARKLDPSNDEANELVDQLPKNVDTSTPASEGFGGPRAPQAVPRRIP